MHACMVRCGLCDSGYAWSSGHRCTECGESASAAVVVPVSVLLGIVLLFLYYYALIKPAKLGLFRHRVGVSGFINSFEEKLAPLVRKISDNFSFIRDATKILVNCACITVACVCACCKIVCL